MWTIEEKVVRDGLFAIKSNAKYLLSLTMYPMLPIMMKPMPTACVIFMNSRLSAVEGLTRDQSCVQGKTVRFVQRLRN
jgi:hypothetical protein